MGPDPVVIVFVPVVPSVVGLGDVGWQFNGQTNSALQLSPSASTLHPQKYASSWNWIGHCYSLIKKDTFNPSYSIQGMNATTITEMNIIIISWAPSVMLQFSITFWKKATDFFSANQKKGVTYLELWICSMSFQIHLDRTLMFQCLQHCCKVQDCHHTFGTWIQSNLKSMLG